MATEEQIEEAASEAQEQLDEFVADTSEYSMEDALDFWEQMSTFCEGRVQATKDDIKSRDG